MNHHKSDDQKIVVHRTIEASADAIFDVVTNPRRHKELDGSGFIRSEEHGDRITATGQVFTMNMEGDHMGGEYKTDNHVTGYAHDRLVAWQTAPAGTEPKGWEWVWELEPQGQHQTEVTLTYDWSKVTDKELLRKVTFPLIKKEELEHSLQRLAETV
ncbi:SRPBCC family protein [Yimella sp. cx-51]|uniref:SRPBCC family protein n=1 Tax=Yimella sp. cx-51 TaxID=2770551 RepID=UPI00165E7349|nr:SRPBCC family protein [Yimella sp. cx-51]MBC9955690.1 polyketide cyclase [Yimella sp. cx-51]QTH37741.1 polyketide cyclase [Yimella sp. cx-51]